MEGFKGNRFVSSGRTEPVPVRGKCRERSLEDRKCVEFSWRVTAAAKPGRCCAESAARICGREALRVIGNPGYIQRVQAL